MLIPEAHTHTSHPTPGGERLKKAKSCVTKLQKEVADAEAEGTKRAVQVGTQRRCCSKGAL
jgi:hypothetical protein